MKRWIAGLAGTLALAASLLVAAPAVAQADSCTVFSIPQLTAGPSEVDTPSNDSAKCGQRWFAYVEYQYEDGGTWHYGGGSSPWDFNFGTGPGATDCSDNVAVQGYPAAAYCYNPDTSGQGQLGYFGAGNQKPFSLPDAESNNGDPCSFRWRQAVSLEDFNNPGVVQGGVHYSPTTPISC